jgi:GAF domain-containing protein
VDDAQKKERYEKIVARLETEFVETNAITARMAQVSALLFKHFEHFFWTGFYTLTDGELTIGPYQGAPASITLEKHQGVCWSAVDRDELVNVPNVHEFAGHIRSEGPSNSEISIPLRDSRGSVIGVLHVDAADFDAFDEIDEKYLQQIVEML